MANQEKEESRRCADLIRKRYVTFSEGTQMLPGGFGNISSALMSLAVWRVLAELYRGTEESLTPVTDTIPEKEWRNQEIIQRYLEGERAVELAREFGISVRRVNRLIHRYLNRGQQETVE